MLKTRQLGNQGLTVSELGLGCMGMSHGYGKSNNNESIIALDYAIEHGITMLDTAEFYGPYINEELIGNWLSHSHTKRDEIILATKFGFDITKSRSSGLDSRPEHIRDVIDASLKRLKTDYIDIFYQHRVDPDVPVEDVAGTVGELVAEGKVRFFGMSEANIHHIRKAHNEFPISVLQSEYSLWERNIEKEILPLLQELNIGLVPFSPLGRGFFTQETKRATQYSKDDFRSWGDPRLQGENFNKNLSLLETTKIIARELNATPAQVAISWILHQSDCIVPIPGSRKISHISDNLKATKLILSPSHIKTLNDLTHTLGVAGDRYTKEFSRFTDNK